MGYQVTTLLMGINNPTLTHVSGGVHPGAVLRRVEPGAVRGGGAVPPPQPLHGPLPQTQLHHATPGTRLRPPLQQIRILEEVDRGGEPGRGHPTVTAVLLLG